MIGFAASSAYSQAQRATFQETAQILVDRTITSNITSSVTLHTTSNQEIKIPTQLSQKILQNPRIVSVILTNQEGCGVLGISDQNCILVNVLRGPEDTNIIKVQESAKKFGDKIIDDVNMVFGTDAKHHSSYLHYRDANKQMLETSGTVSGKDVISAVYAMPKEQTQSMYQKISTLTVAREIRDAGGFYDVAHALSYHDDSHMAFSIIPLNGNLLYQIKVSAEYAGAEDTNQFRPLDYLQVDEITRSKYFEGGFYPLNSIFQIVMLSPQQIQLHDTNTNPIPTVTVDGETIPTELVQNGWIFDETVGTKIEGKYLFGTKTSASGDELALAFGAVGESSKVSTNMQDDTIELDESIAIVAIIAIFAVAAAGFHES